MTWGNKSNNEGGSTDDSEMSSTKGSWLKNPDNNDHLTNTVLMMKPKWNGLELLPGGKQNTANGSEHMDDNTRVMLEQLKEDMREHKQEIRDRDARLQLEMQEREERYRQDSKEREERIRRESIEREERFIKHVEGLFNSQKEVLDLKLNKVDENISRIQQEIHLMTQRVDSIHGRVDNLKYWVIGSVITLLLGIGGIVYANWQVISSMLQIASTK